MGRFPFPHDQRLAHLSYPRNANAEDARVAFLRWRSEIVTSEGARGFVRTRRPDTPDGQANSTVSEGIAYGMLISVMFDDQALFDKGIAYRSEVEIPESIGDLRQYVDPTKTTPAGCLYTGTTRIQFLTPVGNATPQMKVWSPWSKSTLNTASRRAPSARRAPASGSESAPSISTWTSGAAAWIRLAAVSCGRSSATAFP